MQGHCLRRTERVRAVPARAVCVSSACRLCLLKRCVCGWLQAVFAWGVRAHTRVDKFVGLQTACAPAICGFAACLQASSVCVCEFWGARALQMCVHAGSRAVSVCWVFVLRVRVCLHTGGMLQAVLVCVWGGCVCRSVGLQAARGAVRTNLQTVSRVCTCGGVAGCLCALCVCARWCTSAHVCTSEHSCVCARVCVRALEWVQACMRACVSV